MKIVAMVGVGIALGLAHSSWSASATNTLRSCSLSPLKSDTELAKKLTISDDPAGIAVEPKDKTTKVELILQDYATDHQCSFNTFSMLDLAKGLFKGSSDTLSANTTSDSMGGEKYLLIESGKAECIKKLGLDLPLKKIEPISLHFCSLQKLSKDKAMKQQFKFSADPIGLAVSPRKADVNIAPIFQAYAKKHACALYSISMMELMSGLISGPTAGKGLDTNQSKDPAKMNNKYLLVEGDKALCVKKLGLKLPLKSYLPGA